MHNGSREVLLNQFPYAPTIRNAERPRFPSTGYKAKKGEVCRRRGLNPRVYFDSVLTLRPYTTRPHRRYTNI